MRTNRIKQIWRDGKCVTLGWLSVPNSFTAEVMARQGFDMIGGSPEEFAAFIRDDLAKWERVAGAAGLKR